MPINGTALLALQGAIRTRLIDDPGIGALIGDRIYDEVPEGTPMPYITVGDAVETPDNVHGAFGSRATETLHIWSGYAGMAQALTILDRVMALFDHQPLEVAGRDLVAARHEQTVTMRDPDPDVRHVVVRFSFESFQQ